MRSVRPSDLVKVRVPLGLGLRGRDQAIPVGLVDRRFVGEQEPGAHPCRLRAEGKDRRDPPGVANPAGGDHRHRRNGVDHGWDQRQRGHGAPHVTARLPALSHDHIDAGADRSPRLLRVADGVHEERTGVVDLVHVRAGVAPCE